MQRLLVQVFSLGLLLVCISPGSLLARSMHKSHEGAVDVTAFVAPEFQGDRVAAVERAAAEAKGSADNAWMLASSALVLVMTGPGLALFYAGLVRKKNVLGTMMQSFAIWAIVGYSLAFGSGNTSLEVCT